MAWYVLAGSTVEGPFDAPQLLAAYQSGRVNGATSVRRDGEVQWQPLDSVRATLDRELNPGADPFNAPAPPLHLTPQRDAEGPGMNNDVLMGLVFLGLGILITGGTFLLAEGRGGRYVFTWGLIVYGGFRLVRGFMARGD